MRYELKGQDVEKRMMSWFKGKPSFVECFDFETKNVLWEVKSCKLFNTYSNCNSKISDHYKDVKSSHLGRFFINVNNHVETLGIAVAVKKEFKYLFVVVVGKQLVFKSVVHNKLDLSRPNVKGEVCVRIKDVFGDAACL